MCRKAGIRILYKLLWSPDPTNLVAQKRAKFGTISANLTLRESLERIEYQKSEKRVINYAPFHVDEKNGKLWSTNKKLYVRMLTQPRSTLRVLCRLMPLRSGPY